MQTCIDLKHKLAAAHGDALMTSLRGASIVDSHWIEDAIPNASLLVVTFSNGNLACFNGTDGSVIKVGAEATYGQSIIANRRHFFMESVDQASKKLIKAKISEQSKVHHWSLIFDKDTTKIFLFSGLDI